MCIRDRIGVVGVAVDAHFVVNSGEAPDFDGLDDIVVYMVNPAVPG